MAEGGLRGLSGAAGANELRIPDMPTLPKEVRDRFPSLGKWEDEMKEFFKRYARALKQGG
jgi:hypothetical protein